MPFIPNLGVFHEINAGTQYLIAGGALGFIDTNISAQISGHAKMAFFNVYPSADQDAGVRKVGSAISPVHGVNNGVHNFVGPCEVIGGHVELYRAAANNVYYLVGWFE